MRAIEARGTNALYEKSSRLKQKDKGKSAVALDEQRVGTERKEVQGHFTPKAHCAAFTASEWHILHVISALMTSEH